MSNLYKASWVTVDDEDKIIIDNNELANEKIQKYNESIRRNADFGEEGFSEDGFSEGLDADQLSMLTDDVDPNVIGASAPVMEGPSQEEIDQIHAQLEQEIAQAQEQAQSIIADAQAQADAIMGNAIEEGKKQGYNDGYQQGISDAQAERAALEEERASLEKEYQDYVDAAEPEMVDVLTQIYEHVFNVDLRDDKKIILHLLESTLSRIEPGDSLIVHVSSEDYDMVMDHKGKIDDSITSPSTTCEIVEDPLLRANECTIESDGGIFDCSLGVELKELSRKLKLLSFDRKRR